MIKFLLGNEAIAYGLVEGGVEGAYAYPGTPSSEIMEKLIELSGKYRFYVEWSTNEKVALENAIGSSWGGKRVAVIMKHVGLNVASDPLMSLAYTGIKGGFVLVVADDPFSHSSQNEQDSRIYAKFAQIPCLDPSSPEEANRMASYSFELSEGLNIPVMLRSTTRISHTRSSVEIKMERKKNFSGKFEKNSSQWVVIPAHTRRLRVKLSKKQKHIKEALEKLPYNKLEESNSRFGIITSGVSYLYAKEAVASLGIEASFLKIGAYPPSENMINKFLEKLNRVLIIEELTPFVEEFVRVYTKKQDLHIWGKLTGDVPETGEFSPDTVKEVLSKIFRRPFEEKSILPDLDKLLPPRPPVLCAGCPHRATFYAISQVFGKKAIYPSDIGCYTLGLQMGGVDTCLCMGASITISSGLYKSGEKREIVCTIGDSTFLHTGIPGLINAVYNNSRIVVVILDNETTAMTGYQPHPGTGITAQGEKTHKVSFEKIVRACGVSYVETIDPYNLTESIKVFKRVKEESGVRVVIAKRVCALLAKKLDMKRVRFEVTEECIGCQKCLKFGCPAIEWNGEKAQINEQCSGCGVCAQICPVNSIRKKNNEV
ncbi:indolepyruvate ferredoxin oxidoreductase subunit alpha [Candidatus Aerophobetes bacterium]|nr:indolepyruvate ferredoxin oxidoreductase subunit alpha [Candidatus Aerophobetes bacterium]